MLKCDAVFSGGGVKGIGFAGALTVIEAAGYEFQNLAGTSAGAIVAALLAAGYTGAEIEHELMRLDYTKFSESTCLDKLGIIGKALNLLSGLGVYKTDYIESWLTEMLASKNKLVFGDIQTGSKDDRYRYKLQAIASNVSDRRMLVLPGDLTRFGINPDDFPIARAVRMSVSIPFYYMPYRLKGKAREHLVVDGGLLSNYPIWLLDDGTSAPLWPTFGFKFIDRLDEHPDAKAINGVVDYSLAVTETLLEAHDNREVSTLKGDHKRSIVIPTDITLSDGTRKSVKTTDFNITEQESRALFENGVLAARRFLGEWDFERWKRMYR